MDYKGPPQYGTPPPGQAGTPVPQYSSPQPAPAQYGSPQPAQAYAQPPQQYAQPSPPQQAYGQPPQQYAVAPHPQQPIQQQPQHPQHPQQYPQDRGMPPAAAPAQYQPHAPMHNVAPAGSSAWSSSLMDCTPCDTCCLSTFLPCILIGQTSDRLRDPTMATADAMNSDCLVFTAIQCVTGCGWIYVMMKRSEIREHFGIQGDGMGDCCVTYWCPCCALIQQDKEVKVRTSASPITQGYQAQGGMHMPQK